MPTPHRATFVQCLRMAVVPALAAGWLVCGDRADASVILSWDQCGSVRVTNKTFACDTDAGADTLVLSFQDSFTFSKLARADIAMHVCFMDNALPDWWSLLATDGCRFGSLTPAAASLGGSCASAWDPVGGATQSIALTPITTLNGFLFSVSVSAGDPAQARDLVAGQQYELVRVVLDHRRTTGLGACSGCATTAEIGADGIWLYSTDGSNLGTSTISFVTWQTGAIGCRAITPVQNRTWGSIKTLYR